MFQYIYLKFYVFTLGSAEASRCNYWGQSALEPVLRNKRNHHSERPVHTAAGEWPPAPFNQRKARAATKTQHCLK